MTAKELIKELKAYPSDAKVYIVNDWENVDEDGSLNDLTELRGLTSQHVVIDEGLDFTDVTEILIDA